jgi:hypothetical protein
VAYFQHIEDGKIINTIVAETLEDAELATGGTCVEYFYPEFIEPEDLPRDEDRTDYAKI